MQAFTVLAPPERPRSGLTLRLHWRDALLFMTREPGWKGKILVGGLMMLCLPPLGWLMALGYRSITGKRLTTGVTPALPPWRGSLTEAFGRGVKASGVILAYLAPALAAFVALGAGSATALMRHGQDVIVALVACVIFPPAAIPALPVIAFFRWPWFALSVGESISVAVLAIAAIALLPSAFLRVAATSRFSAAFQVRRAVRFVIRNPAGYLEAWALSLCVSVCAVVVLPLTPWLLFWSYLVILHAFLQVLWRGRERLQEHQIERSR